MTDEELERPCWICSNARKKCSGQYWVDLPQVHTTREDCGHREPELSIVRNRYRRKPSTSEVRFNPISSVRVA